MDEVINISLDDEQKAFLSNELGINIDSDLFDPRYDYVFKRIFTADNEKSKLALIDFLNSLLEPYRDDEIKDLTVINPGLPVDRKDHKKSVFDIRVIFKSNEQAIVEMQFGPKADFKKRSQFLISKLYSSQRLSGLQYGELKKCYLICVTNFILFSHEEDNVKDFMYRDICGRPLTDDTVIIFLELPKMDLLLGKPIETLNNSEMWAMFLKYASDKNRRGLLNQILKRRDGIKMAAQVLDLISKDEQERMLYESQLLYEADQMYERIYRDRMITERVTEEVTERVTEEVTGRVTEEVGLSIARNLKLKNIPLDIISEGTGISIDILEAL